MLIKFLETVFSDLSQEDSKRAICNAENLDNVSVAKLKLVNFLLRKSATVGPEDGNVGENVLKILELGAGTGACSIAVAALTKAFVYCTDLKEFQYLIDQNIGLNFNYFKGASKVMSYELDWSKIELSDLKNEAFDLFLVSDCIYYEESVEPLFIALDHFCSNDAIVVMSIEDRTEKTKLVEKFWSLMDGSFTWHEISVHEQNELFRCDEIHLFVIYKTAINKDK